VQHLKRFFIFSMVFIAFSSTSQSQPHLISFEKKVSYTKAQVDSIWKARSIPRFIAPVKYGVDFYEVMYSTKWHDGSPIKASGVVMVPTGGKPAPFHLLGYHHGTRTDRHRDIGFHGEHAICAAFAVAGFAVAYPDYVGLGKGDKFHLYHHSETEAYSSIDLMRAVREMQAQLGFALSGKVFLSGYSQGGHATMAAHRFIEERHLDEFNLIASSPMSGAYDLTGVQSEVMFKPYTQQGYLPYLLIGYNEAYRLYPDVNMAFRSPYDTLLTRLFDGTRTLGAVNRLMPPIPKDVLKEELVAEYLRNPDQPFRRALAQNTHLNWAPKRPMQLCYCDADEQVSYRNALVAEDSLNALGAYSVKARRTDSRFGHRDCAPFSAMNTKMYFDSFLRGSKKGRKGPLFKRMLIGIARNKVASDNRKGK
jgi:pimeloyl-ACP methyl ester carboxylesterase